MFPAMSRWTSWCYGAPSMLLYDHQHIIESMCGVQQGDPLGPLYVCCGIMGLVNEINQLGPIYNKWYMDDGGIVGDVDLLLKVWALIQSRGPELGLYLNPSKCEWSWLDGSCSLPCPIRLPDVDEEAQIKLVPTSEIQMLGVPLGSTGFVDEFVRKKLLARLDITMEKLVEFEDSQAAMYLLRVSYGIVRAVHFMRTTPLSQWMPHAVQFDAKVRDTAEQILGRPLSDASYRQASISTRLGGLGLRRTVDHAGLAFAASWHESKSTAREDWVRPFGVPEMALSQRSASFKFDEGVHALLLASAPNDREYQRLSRCAQPHANGFLTAVPSCEDGYDTVLPPRNYRVAVLTVLAYQLLLVMFPALCARSPCFRRSRRLLHSEGDIIRRHNSLRNFIDGVASDDLLSPVMEVSLVLRLAGALVT